MTSYADAIAKAIGGSDERQKVSVWLDTGYPPLNKALSASYDGGLPLGRIIEMFGPESSGKTAIATRAMIAAQQAGGFAFFADHENSFDVDLAEGMGLSTDPNCWLYQTPDTFEDSINRAIKLAKTLREAGLPNEKPIIVVFDSLASMVPRSKSDKGVDEYTMHDTTALARATSAVFPALASFSNKYQVCMLFLNQMRLKPGVAYGDPTTTPGGESPKFYASVRIKLGRKKLVDKDKNFLGQQINAEVIKNKVSRPFEKAQWNFMFKEDGTGYFDVKTSLVEYLLEIGKLEAKGPRIEWEGKSLFKSQLVETVTEDELKALL